MLKRQTDKVRGKTEAEGERKRDGEPFNEGQSRTKRANAIERDTIYRAAAKQMHRQA